MNAGGGAADTDFVLFVSAVETATCTSGSTLAYAGTCVRDQYDRPTFGAVNFCPSDVSAEAGEWESQLTVALHELLHALGFSRTSWALFRHADGTPRTPRDATTGLPPKQDGVECVDGVTRNTRTTAPQPIFRSPARVPLLST